MATSAIPDVIDALFTLCQTNLTGVTVYDGYGSSSDPGDFLMIGVEDPNSANPANSADSRQQWANATGTARDEQGLVTCAAVSWNGDADQKAARTAAFATVAAVENLIRTDYTLGGLSSLLWCEIGGSTGTGMVLTQATNASGALAQVVFRVHYRARI